MSPKAGVGLRGPANEYSCADGAQMNSIFNYLTYGLPLLKVHTTIKQTLAPFWRSHLHGDSRLELEVLQSVR
jgi:hypothetical protein